MSIQVTNNVWKYSRANGTPLLVLLCLADSANEDGECWPSISSIGKKCRLKDERHVRRVIHEVLQEELGEVAVILGGGRASRKGGVRSNRYRVTVHLPLDDETLVERPPLVSKHPGLQTHHDPGSGTPQTLVDGPPEPSLNHQGESSVEKKARKRRKGPATVPDNFAVTDEMRRWCSAKGIRSDPAIETERFLDHHRAKGSLFVDPISAWRNWMRRADEISRAPTAAPDSRSKSMRTVDAVLESLTNKQEALQQ